MHRSSITFFAMLIFFAADMSPAIGQSGFSLVGHAGYHGLGGDDFEGIDPGFGFDGTARYLMASGLALGAGAGYSVHSLDGFSEDLGLLDVYGEIRYTFPTSNSNVEPFLGGRAGYSRISIDVEENGVGVTAEADGFSGSGVGGVEIWVSPQVAVELSGQAGFMSLSEIEAAGFTALGTESNGFRYGLDIGLNILFGRGEQ